MLSRRCAASSGIVASRASPFVPASAQVPTSATLTQSFARPWTFGACALLSTDACATLAADVPPAHRFVSDGMRVRTCVDTARKYASVVAFWLRDDGAGSSAGDDRGEGRGSSAGRVRVTVQFLPMLFTPLLPTHNAGGWQPRRSGCVSNLSLADACPPPFPPQEARHPHSQRPRQLWSCVHLHFETAHPSALVN